jgi:hypothetical protein
MSAVFVAVGNLAFALSSVVIGLRRVRLWSRLSSIEAAAAMPPAD